MKNRRSTYFYICILLLIFSCQSKEEKLIQTQLDKIVGRWKIDSFEPTSTAPNEFKGLVKSGEFEFDRCRAKNIRPSNSLCSAGIQLNDEIYDLAIRFDDYFTFSFGPISKDGTGNVVFSKDVVLLMQLMNGKWELTVSNNTLIGKQVANPRNPNLLSSFTATRQ